jgi:hypothetical protein
MKNQAEKREAPSQMNGKSIDDSSLPKDNKLEMADPEELKERKIFQFKRKEVDASSGQPIVEKAATESTFNFKFEHPKDYKPLFGSGTFTYDASKSNGSLFGFPKKEEQKEEPAKENPEEPNKPTEVKPAESKPSLFGNLANGSGFGGIFGSNAQTSLFKTDTNSSSLFGNANTSGSIFGNLSKGDKSKVNGNSDDSDDQSNGEGDDNENKEQTDEEEVKKKAVFHHDYKSPYETITTKSAFNFRIEKEEPLGTGFVFLEKLKESSPESEEAEKEKPAEDPLKNLKYPVLVFRNKAQNILHSSFLIPKLTALAFLKNRKDALVMSVLIIPPKKEGEVSKPKQLAVKILFNSEQDAEEFKLKAEEALKTEN